MSSDTTPALCKGMAKIEPRAMYPPARPRTIKPRSGRLDGDQRGSRGKRLFQISAANQFALRLNLLLGGRLLEVLRRFRVGHSRAESVLQELAGFQAFGARVAL